MTLTPAERQTFAAVWNAGASMVALCKQFHLGQSGVGQRVYQLRKLGYLLTRRRRHAVKESTP